MINSVITGTGSYIPTLVKKNSDFLTNKFLKEDGSPFEYENEVVIEKFRAITGIEERRYATKDLNSSDLGYFAAKKAIEDAGINQEDLDYIILAHNFGDVKSAAIQSDILPSLASRVKYRLGIKNPKCVAYDILFGCPGWIQGVIQAEAYIKVGIAKKCLVIGTETLSRVIDDHDRDSMIYSDGAGACIVEAEENSSKKGILSYAAQTDTLDECYYLFFGNSFDKTDDPDVRYIKMYGRKIYEYALNNVPLAMKAALDKSEIDIKDIKKIFIHQANEKMDEAIIKRFYRLHKMPVPKNVMPMSIHTLGNSSVATVPTLFDLIKKGEIEDQEIHKGDIVIFASVGAGMNINAIVYKY
ncbi:3-oxoacyl-ACP synthase III family protein [Lutibacter sp. B1]|nr:3-oxoacyl-ACP synthase III family protein [Lutibacter sp. B1]